MYTYKSSQVGGVIIPDTGYVERCTCTVKRNVHQAIVQNAYKYIPFSFPITAYFSTHYINVVCTWSKKAAYNNEESILS